MEIKVNSQGNLEIDIKDLLSNLDDDEAESLIQGLAWDTRTWKVIKEAVKNEHGAFHYNEELLLLRVAFLTEWDDDYDNPYTRVGEVISALLTEIDLQRQSARSADRAFWKLYHQVKEATHNSGINIEMPKSRTMHFFHKPAYEIACQYMPEMPEEEE
jgi:hypothetical protein